MTQVKLLGELGDKFGSDWTSESNSVRDIFRLIDCQVDGLKEYLAECQEKNIGFTIQNGDDFIEDVEDLVMPVLKDTVIITAVPAGSGKGLGKILGGLLILGAMFFIPGSAALFTNSGAILQGAGVSQGIISSVSAAQALSMGTMAGQAVALNTLGTAVMMMGLNLALTGIAEASAPDAGKGNDDPAYFFNGAENNIEQGAPVPLLYGKMKIGGTPIGQGFAPGRIRNTNGYIYARGDVDYLVTDYYGNASFTGATDGGSGGGGTGQADIDPDPPSAEN